jgi:hypothetical protein
LIPLRFSKSKNFDIKWTKWVLVDAKWTFLHCSQ